MPETAVGQLVRSALGGDKASFSELVRQHQAVVFNLVLQSCRNRADADDIAQDSFVRAYRNLRKLRNPDRFSSWLYGIAVNVAREYARKRPAFVPLDSLPEPAAPDVGDKDGDKEKRLLTAIGELPEKYRIALTMRYTHRMKYRDIGDTLGIAERTARTRVHRARVMLHSALSA